MRAALLLPAAFALTACAEMTATAPVVVTAPKTAASVTTSAPTAPAAMTPAPAGGSLGSVTASLGDASQGGLWLKSGLVKAPAKGRIVDAATGKTVAVDLLPLAGGAPQLSVGAMQALGLGLTDLPKIDVFRA